MELRADQVTDEVLDWIIEDSNYRTREEVIEAIEDGDTEVYDSKEAYLAGDWDLDENFYGELPNGYFVRYIG